MSHRNKNDLGKEKDEINEKKWRKCTLGKEEEEGEKKRNARLNFWSTSSLTS